MSLERVSDEVWVDPDQVEAVVATEWGSAVWLKSGEFVGAYHVTPEMVIELLTGTWDAFSDGDLETIWQTAEREAQ